MIWKFHQNKLNSMYSIGVCFISTVCLKPNKSASLSALLWAPLFLLSLNVTPSCVFPGNILGYSLSWLCIAGDYRGNMRLDECVIDKATEQ